MVSRLAYLCRVWSAIVGGVESYATIDEVARLYRVSYNHVWRMCVDGRLPAVRVGQVWRIPRQSLPSVTKSRSGGADAAGGAAGPEDLKKTA